MAEATLAIEEVMIPREINIVTLKLTEAEAMTLSMVTQLIGGSPGDSVREFTDNILRALEDAGYYYRGCLQSDGVVENAGGIYFMPSSRAHCAKALGVDLDA